MLFVAIITIFPKKVFSSSEFTWGWPNIFFFSYTDVVNLLLCSSHTLIFWRFIIMIALFKGNWDKEGGASPSAELRLLTAAGQPEPQSQRFGIGPQRSNSPAASSNFLLDILFSNKIWLRNSTLNHAIFFRRILKKSVRKIKSSFAFEFRAIGVLEILGWM